MNILNYIFVCKGTFTPTLVLFRIKFKFWKSNGFSGLSGDKKNLVLKMGETYEVNYSEEWKGKKFRFGCHLKSW